MENILAAEILLKDRIVLKSQKNLEVSTEKSNALPIGLREP